MKWFKDVKKYLWQIQVNTDLANTQLGLIDKKLEYITDVIDKHEFIDLDKQPVKESLQDIEDKKRLYKAIEKLTWELRYKRINEGNE